MLQLYHEQLSSQLNKGLGLSAVYLLLGNDFLLLQESYDAVRNAAIINGFDEHYTFQLDNSTDWQAIFSLCQTIGLFTVRRTIQLILPENGPNVTINEQLIALIDFLHDDLLLIVRGNKLTKSQKSAAWFVALSPFSIQVSCMTPERENLLHWVVVRAKNNNLQIDVAACQLLCYCYEGNLLALAQILERLSLLWPYNKLTLSHVEQVVNDAAHFTPFHWIDALLMAKIERALRILRQLRLEDIEPVILLRALQRELLLLVNLKRQSINIPLCSLFDKYCIWQNRRVIITRAFNRISKLQLHYAIQLLTHIELILKQEYDQSLWNELENLSLLLCHEVLSRNTYS